MTRSPPPLIGRISLRAAVRCCFFLAALLGAAAIAALLASRIPRQLQVSTDIVGFPTFYDYNIRRISDLYVLVVVLFPLGALVLYVALTQLATRLGLLNGTVERVGQSTGSHDVDAKASGWASHVASGARLAGLGCIGGLEIAVARGDVYAEFWKTVGATTLAYLLAAFAAGWILKRTYAGRYSLSATLSGINAAVSPAALVGLLAISLQTTLTVTAPPTTHHYPWFPVWLAVPLVTGAGVLIAGAIIRGRSERSRRALERKALIVLGGSALVFLFHSRLPGALGPMNMFDEGEYLVPAQLTAAGAFPWRDLLTIHGLLQDTLSPMLGQHLLDDSRWGAAAGWQLVLYPLGYVSLLLFGARFFWRNWPFLLAFGVLLLGSVLVPPFTRFIFWPLILILLSFVLERPRWWLGVLLGASLVAQAVLVPEAAYGVPACGLAVLLRDATTLRGTPFWPAVSRTVWTTTGAAATLLALVAVLVKEQALQSFIFYFVIFAPGHDLTGAFVVPSGVPDVTGVFMIVSPIVALLASALYFSIHLVRRASLDMDGWVMVAAAVMTALYYPKYLDRADAAHLRESFWVAIPLIALVAFKACHRLDAAVLRIPPLTRAARGVALRPVALALLLATIVLAPASLIGQAEVMAHQFRAFAPSEPWLDQLGYGRQDAMDRASYDDIRTVLSSYLGPDDWIFDFSNAPGLYYYLLGYTPHTRYYHVSMAIPQAAQEDLVAQLRRDPPKLVVLFNGRYGADDWDAIPNMVRHYAVSQYILDNYRPLLSVRGQLLYVRNDARVPSPGSLDPRPHEPVVTSDLAFQARACRWGYSPNSLSTSPGPATPTPVAGTAAPPADAIVRGSVWDPHYAVWEVVLVVDGQVAATQTSPEPLPDRARLGDPMSGTVRGFELAVPRSTLEAARSIQVLSITYDGTAQDIPFDRAAQQLPGTPGNAPAVAQPVVPGVPNLHLGSPAVGAVESIILNPHVVEILPPSGKTWASYRWLEITSRPGFGTDEFSLSDRLAADTAREISFETTSSSPQTYRVQVGSCAQWHGYGAEPLFLTYSDAENIASIKLVP
ncbi:MAG: hypothetical protein J2P40_03220 [Candidatus Dormibacteraeota bacterium]|nr:hypothetical protein [Candidatus Dormibacteraeota bacterium]